MLDNLTVVILAIAASVEFVIIVACLIMLNDDIRRLKIRNSEIEKEIKEFENRSAVQHNTLADTVKDIEKRKADRWDYGKTYWNTQDWDERK